MKTLKPVSMSAMKSSGHQSLMKTTSRSVRWIDPNQASSRRGAVMIFALVALLVASLMIGSLLRTAAMSHRQLKRDEFQLQANLIADAGCERALLLLRSQPDFDNGEWSIPAEQLGPDRTALVRMAVTRDSNNDSEQLITVVAQFPVGHPDLVRVTRQIHVH